MSDFDRALEHALNGDAVLFVGAGFSLGAKNLRKSSFKTGRKLAEYLAELVELPTGTPLDDAAEEFARQKSEAVLITELQQEFTVSELAEHHISTAQIPWRRIYTTNYDNVLERAYSQVSRRLNPVTTNDHIRVIPKDDAMCIHLNGYIDRLNRDTLWSEFKLTEASYVSTSLLDSPWLVLFREDLRLARAVFFLGYSLADLDIKRVLFETSGLQEKTFFVLGGRSDTVTAHRASRFGTVLPEDAATFASKAAQKAMVYSLPRLEHRIGYSIQKFETPRTLSSFSDRHVFDLLLHGDLKNEFVWSSLHSGQDYFCERSAITRVLEQFERPDPIMVVHSDLGNGKTLLIEGIKFWAIELGYDVYVVTTRTDEIFDELRTVLDFSDSSKKVLLVIDNYPDWLDVIEYVGLHAEPKTALLLSARSSVHDVMIDRLCTLLGRSSVAELSVDYFSPFALPRIPKLNFRRAL